MTETVPPRIKRARKPALGKHVPKPKLAKRVFKLREEGMTVPEIAKHLGKSPSTIFRALRYVKDRAATDFVPEVKEGDSLRPEIRALLSWNVDAFERFYLRYSPYDYLPAHSKEIVRRALSSKRVVLNVPPGHAKSQVMAVWVPIWLICRDRNASIVILSKTGDLARQRAREIANHLEQNSLLVADFGRFRPETQDLPWHPNSGEFIVQGRTEEHELSGSWTLQSRGAGQQIFGVRLTHLIVDDLVDTQNSATPTQRENLERWFRVEALSRFRGGTELSWAVDIGTRFHPNDLHGSLIADKRADGTMAWEHINFPAVIQWPSLPDKSDAVVLWPEQWPFERLMEEAYVDVGEAGFEQTYQQNPIPGGSALVRREWVYGDVEHPGCTDLDRDLGRGVRGTKTGAPIVRVVSLDPPITRYAGLIVADLTYSRDMFFATIIECQRRKMDVREMLEALDRVYALYTPDYFVFEQNAAQRWFLQDPQLDAFRQRVRVVPHNTARNKGDPILGIQSLAIDFEFGRIKFPYASPEAKQNSELLIQEALSYPYGDTDDLLMSLWFLKFNYPRLVPRRYETGTSRTKRGPGFAVPPRLEDGWPDFIPKERVTA